MRQRTRARRGGGIPPTKYRAADGGCSVREESSFSPKRETNACAVSPVPEGAMRGHGGGRQPSGPKQGEASCAGLRPEGIYVYVERSQGRTNRPPCTGSTVAPTVTAHWKANQHRKANTRQARCQANKHTANTRQAHTHTGQPKLANRPAAKSYVPSCGDGVPDGIITTTQRSNA